MQCSCTVPTWCDGAESRWSEREIRAAKEHKCYECDAVINKGDKFWYHTIFDESITNFKICQNCEALMNSFFDDGWTFGEVRDNLMDYLRCVWQEDLPSSCISKLPKEAQQFVCDYLQEYQEGE